MKTLKDARIGQTVIVLKLQMLSDEAGSAGESGEGVEFSVIPGGVGDHHIQPAFSQDSFDGIFSLYDTEVLTVEELETDNLILCGFLADEQIGIRHSCLQLLQRAYPVAAAAAILRNHHDQTDIGLQVGTYLPQLFPDLHVAV